LREELAAGEIGRACRSPSPTPDKYPQTAGMKIKRFYKIVVKAAF
jgi:hypothetical protein